MAFGQLEATGLVLFLVLLLLLIAAAVSMARARRLNRQAADARAAVIDLQERARIGALRHKDFDKWFDEDAKRRAKVGLPALDREVARARRFDPTYELDVPAPRRGALHRKRAELAEAVDRGEEPQAVSEES